MHEYKSPNDVNKQKTLSIAFGKKRSEPSTRGRSYHVGSNKGRDGVNQGRFRMHQDPAQPPTGHQGHNGGGGPPPGIPTEAGTGRYPPEQLLRLVAVLGVLGGLRQF